MHSKNTTRSYKVRTAALMNPALGACWGTLALIMAGLALGSLTGCSHWFLDMKGYLEHWTGTVQVSGLDWSANPESQQNLGGVDTISTNAQVSVLAAIANPEGYSLDAGVGSEQDVLRSVRVSGMSGSSVLPRVSVVDSSTTSISLLIKPFSSVPTPESLALEHTDFTVSIVPTRSDSGQSAVAKTLTLRYNTPPRMPLEVVYNQTGKSLDWMGADGWEMVQGVDPSLDNYIYWAWPRGITDPTAPDCVERFQVYVDGVLSQVGYPHQFEYNDYSQVSPRLADYHVYRAAVSSGTKVEVYALDVEGVSSPGTGSGIAPHKITLDASGGFFASSGTSGVELYKAHGSRVTGGDLESPVYYGHYLSGWSTSAGGNPVTFPYSIEAPVTLYALWTAYPAGGGDTGGDVPDGSASGEKPSVTLDGSKISSADDLRTVLDEYTDCEITVDLGGKQLEVTDTDALPHTPKEFFTVKDGNKVTITNGTVVMSGDFSTFSNYYDFILFSVGTGSTLDLSGCTLTGTDFGDAGIIAVKVSGGGSVTLTDTTIANFDSNSDGAGVYVELGGSATMNGGAITDNEARYGAAVYLDGSFIMNGGEISGNYSINGSTVSRSGTFEWNGGTISNNKNGTVEGGSVFGSGINYRGSKNKNDAS